MTEQEPQPTGPRTARPLVLARRAGRGGRRVLGMAAALPLIACDAPHYVSLGWNDSAVHAESTPSDGGLSSRRGLEEAAASDFVRAGGDDPRQPCVFGLASVELPAACEARPLAACPELGETVEMTLDAVLSSLLRECGELDNAVSVSFEQGCAVAFELASDASALAAAPSADAGAPERGFARRCLAERLAAQRLACAQSIACGTGVNFPSPTR